MKVLNGFANDPDVPVVLIIIMYVSTKCKRYVSTLHYSASGKDRNTIEC